MRKYLVTARADGTQDMGELPPNARVLTREQFAKAWVAVAQRNNTRLHLVTVIDIMDELFDEESDDV